MSSQLRTQLPRDARRVVIRGASGSGKTTLATRIAASVALPHVELDGIFHQPDWTPLEDEAFIARVDAFRDDESWVTCGNYSVIAPLLLERADTLVLYDLPKRVVMWRVITRTLGRGFRQQELWNGNKEQLRNILRRDPTRSIIAWSWTTHARYHETMVSLATSPPHAGIRVIHLCSTADERLLYAGLPPARAPAPAAPVDLVQQDGA